MRSFQGFYIMLACFGVGGGLFALGYSEGKKDNKPEPKVECPTPNFSTAIMLQDVQWSLQGWAEQVGATSHCVQRRPDVSSADKAINKLASDILVRYIYKNQERLLCG